MIGYDNIIINNDEKIKYYHLINMVKWSLTIFHNIVKICY